MAVAACENGYLYRLSRDLKEEFFKGAAIWPELGKAVKNKRC